MRLIKLFLIVCFLLQSMNTFACYPAKITLKNRVKNADIIYIGVVIDVLAPHKKIDQVGIMGAVTHLPQAYALKIMVEQVIKGTDNNNKIEAEILNCGSGSAKLKDKVIVFNSKGYWYTQVFNQKVYNNLRKLIN